MSPVSIWHTSPYDLELQLCTQLVKRYRQWLSLARKYKGTEREEVYKARLRSWKGHYLRCSELVKGAAGRTLEEEQD